MTNRQVFPARLALLAKRNQSWLMRVGVVSMTVCVLPVIGFLMTKDRYSALVLGAIAVPFGIVAVMNRLELGIIAILLAGFCVRFRIPTGTASEVVISLMITAGCIALWVIHMLAVEKRVNLKPAPTNVPLLAFMATVAVSWGWGRAFRDVFVHEAGHPLVSVIAGLMMVLLPASFLLTANSVRSERWLQVMVWGVLAEGSVALAVDLGSHFGIAPMRDLADFLHTNGILFVNTHGLLSMWCMALAVALALMNRRMHWILRLLLLVYAGAWVYWGFFLRIRWLSGWIPPFVAAAVVAFVRSKRLFIIVMIVMVVGAGGHYMRTEFAGESERSGSTRWAAYQVNWRVTSKHLLFGTGPAGYASYYMSYFPTEAMASHSNYIDILAQTGIVGTIFLLWFFVMQAWNSFKLQLKLRNRGDFAESLSAAVLAGTVGCVIAMALGDWLLPFMYTQGLPGFDLAVFNWLFMGSVWALRYSQESTEELGVQGGTDGKR